MIKNWQKVIVSPTTTIREVLEIIDKEALRVAIVVLGCDTLVGIVTDGDIRRGILQGIELSAPVSTIMNNNPTSANVSLSSVELKTLMQERKILSLPIVDDSGKLVGLKTLYDTLVVDKRENPVFIMAGGFGTRLRPLTDHCPKPMLKVGGKPMLETLINNFKNYGFYKFFISTHYLPEVIMNHFGDGSNFGIEITYIHETTPLGTGGALSLLPKSLPKEPLIMINGDILTNVDFAKVLDFHVKQHSDATMCVRDYEIKVPFGVIEGTGHEITNIVEKPTYRYFVNAGIYVISNHIIESLPNNEHLDMPTLFEQKQKVGCKTLKFPIHEYWLDVGRHDDFNKAQSDIYELGI
ncbi:MULTISPECIES: nucleotidyltransferase family protein [unclassified Pseudoalteromonas]|uniref:nucleotidyltransferase family protein n=1 Tax=unclassified Pseudoalteromonas TaxID=194690 RepID=UPI0025B459A9|nr:MULTISPECIES: nucleotidyltransferase family protein [unclassified Pseudoalteromonas]MDN3379113.1 nucleotidyltransferase family protein [Pseudoalteromonas sp. APC 3893]MDN3387812.1 nucleotidyltransferase family protein [Pseudoalteromonas sp. APC 4017]